MLHDLMDQASYMAHGYCLLWKPWLVGLHAVSDVLIFASYFAIPAAIWSFVRQRADLELKSLALLFAAFIFLCGLTHLIQFITLWWPVYETQGAVKFATALVSVATAIAIFPLVPKALAIPSPTALRNVNLGLEAEIVAHRQTQAELVKAKDELEERVAERTRQLQVSNGRFEALVLASAQIVWTADNEGKVLEDSPSWRAFTGQSYDEWKGFGWLDAVHPDDRASAEAAWRSAILSNQNYRTEYRLKHTGGTWRWMEAKGVQLKTPTGETREWVGMNIDIEERRQAQDHTQFVVRELSHRTKNLLAVVYSMARQAAKTVQPEGFLEDFAARIQGLSRSHDLLVAGDWQGAPLEEHLKSQLQPFFPATPSRITFDGPPLILKPEATQALGLAFHELATNASKHGALSQPNGSITVAWSIDQKGAFPYLHLVWSERTKGIVFTPTDQKGFGHTVLMRVVPESLSGEASQVITDEGVVWTLDAPVAEIVA